MLKWCCSILFLLLSFTHVFSQQILGDSVNNHTKQRSLKGFDKLYSDQLPISKGVIFRPIDNQLYAGSTYLGEKEVYIGDVLYQGVWYTQLNLVYDIYSDQLIHVKPTGEWIVLVKPEVERFTLADRHFVNNPTIYEQGSSFFETISTGKAELLAKYSMKIGNYDFKILRRPLASITKLIIHNLNNYYEVERKGDVLKALKNKRSEITEFIKAQKLDFKNNFQGSVKQIVVYYNQLN